MYFKVALFVLFFGEISEKLEIFPVVPNFVQYVESELCKIDSNIYKNNLKNYTLWAHKMLDSSAKGTFSILTGNDHQLGNYQECLNIQGPFATQYCLVGLTLNFPPHNSTNDLFHNGYPKYESVFTKLEHFKTKNVKFGLCFPASCSASDIQTSLTESLTKVEKPFKSVGITYNVTAIKEFCSNYLPPKIFGKLEISFCILTFILVILVFSGTIVDLIIGEEENLNKFSLWKELCLSFSARKNLNQLFNLNGYQEETRIFDAVRCISMMVIFLGHFLAAVQIIPTLHGLTLDGILNSKVYYTIEQFDLVVDTFFVISGLLLVHGSLNKWNDLNVNPIWLVILRYVRLTPLNVYVSLYYVTILTYFGSGPMWNITYIVFIQVCKKNNNWWLNFFYINNFMAETTEACNSVTWFISCDFQLFVMGVIVMFIIQKNYRVGYSILGFLLILSIIAAFTITKIYKIMPHMGIYGTDEFKNFGNNYYTKPYIRASSYILGMLGGFAYEKLKSKQEKISTTDSYIVAGISLLLMGISYAYLIFAFNGQENYAFEFAFYNALHRPIWCIGVLGILFVASYGSISPMSSFLSSSFWTPFARLTYGFYLIHFVVLISNNMTSVTVKRLHFFDMATLFIALVGMSYIFASILYIIIEAPFVKISKIIILRKFYENQARNISEEYQTVGENGMVTELE